MEARKLKVNLFKSGSGSINAKVTLPITWIRSIGVTAEDREINVEFDEEKKEIIIKKR